MSKLIKALYLYLKVKALMARHHHILMKTYAKYYMGGWEFGPGSLPPGMKFDIHVLCKTLIRGHGANKYLSTMDLETWYERAYPGRAPGHKMTEITDWYEKDDVKEMLNDKVLEKYKP